MDKISLWCTDIHYGKYPGEPEERGRVLSYLIKLKEEGRGLEVSNKGGFHSDFNSLMELMQPVASYISKLIQDMHSLEGRGLKASMVSAWGNLSQEGDYMAYHVHPGSSYSAVLYLETGPGGSIAFRDPRPSRELVEHRYLNEGTVASFEPQNGHLVLFPSWLGHSVNSFQGEGLRASVAMNFLVSEEAL